MSNQTTTARQSRVGFVKRCGKVSTARLIALLQAHFPQPGPATLDPQKPRYLVRRPNGIEFEYFEPKLAGHVVVRWTEGRVFSPELEIRWRKVAEDRYDVLVLAEQDLSLGDEFEAFEGPWQVVERNEKRYGLFLWGEHQPDWQEERKGTQRPYWVEVRIPNRLYYPAKEAGAKRSFARVSYRVYQTDQGVTRFIRLAEVEDVSA